MSDKPTPEGQLRLCRALWPEREFSIFGEHVGPHIRRVDEGRCDTVELTSDEAAGRMALLIAEHCQGLTYQEKESIWRRCMECLEVEDREAFAFLVLEVAGDE